MDCFSMHASVDKEDMSLSFTVVSKREEEENIAFYHKEPRKGSGFADTIQLRRDHREIHREKRETRRKSWH